MEERRASRRKMINGSSSENGILKTKDQNGYVKGALITYNDHYVPHVESTLTASSRTTSFMSSVTSDRNVSSDTDNGYGDVIANDYIPTSFRSDDCWDAARRDPRSNPMKLPVRNYSDDVFEMTKLGNGGNTTTEKPFVRNEPHRSSSKVVRFQIGSEVESAAESEIPAAARPRVKVPEEYRFYRRRNTIVKLIAVSKISEPGTMRLRLRNLLLFLIITNACLWAFMSLDGTAFTIYTWESQYYAKVKWGTILAICRPFSIFYRMHSAGCLYEIWSFG